jgi:hypothetical protein
MANSKASKQATEITVNLLKTLRTDIDAALTAVAKKYGVSLAAGSASYSATQATFKLTVGLLGENGVVVDPRAADWPKYCGMFGLKPEWLGKVIHGSRGPLTITGLDTKKHKFPVIAIDAAGRGIKMTAEFVLEQLDPKAAKARWPSRFPR